MKRAVGYRPEEIVVVSAEGTECPCCGGGLWITQHRDRWVQRLDAYVHLIRQDRRCMNERCSGPRPLYRPPEDLRFALPRKTFGFDVTLAIGERHLAGETLGAIGRDLNDRGVPIDQRHVGRLFRDFLALWKSTGHHEAMVRRLHAQGGAVLMADGVQFEGQSPVLYVVWDAISGMPILGERREFRSKDGLKLVLERVKALEVPVRAIVTDKEKSLVPAVKETFPEVPYQHCQTHFLSNCAQPLKADCEALSSGVKERAERVRRIAERIHQVERAEAASASEAAPPSGPSGTAPEPARDLDPELRSERGFAKEVCDLARQSARRTGKAPLDPAALRQHECLDELLAVVEERRDLEKGGPEPSEGWAAPARWVGGVPLVGRSRCGAQA